jgi:predicted dehydrogenase
MNILVVGAGRMGMRHLLGVLSVEKVKEVGLWDLSLDALSKAKESLAGNVHQAKIQFIENIESVNKKYSVVIIATPAQDRLRVCSMTLKFKPDYLLIEKPLGQSLNEVIDLNNLLKSNKVNAFVNLNMRLYDFVNELKSDLNKKPQLKGPININFSGGSLGIGANGIHYLDLLFYLYGAESAELVAGGIEDTIIPSGRGPNYGDFGGWACINFFDTSKNYLGRSLLQLSSTSTVFGGWDIIGSHGRIRLNELESERVDIFRKEESQLPINRYAGDYLPREVKEIISPALSDITKKWIHALMDGKQLLPSIDDSIKVHKLLFDWLALSRQFQDRFPIT